MLVRKLFLRRSITANYQNIEPYFTYNDDDSIGAPGSVSVTCGKHSRPDRVQGAGRVRLPVLRYKVDRVQCRLQRRVLINRELNARSVTESTRQKIVLIQWKYT